MAMLDQRCGVKSSVRYGRFLDDNGVIMTDVVVVGDGPGGLSAALFLAKNQMRVTVFGDDKTAMHAAHLRNYLGIPDILGSEFQRIALEQVKAAGARIERTRVESVAGVKGAFEIALEGGGKLTSRYLILGEGRPPKLVRLLGLEISPALGVSTDKNARTEVDGLYVLGRSARPGRSQAIISAGDGAAAALDILSAEKGGDYVDWDSVDGA